MADMLRDGVAWLRDQLKASVAHDVTYTRTGTGSVTIAATIGQQQYRTVDPDDGRSILFRSDRDFIVDPTLLTIASVAITPAEGDRITDGTETFEVCPINGEPCYRPSDGFGKTIRIHTMKVAG